MVEIDLEKVHAHDEPNAWRNVLLIQKFEADHLVFLFLIQLVDEVEVCEEQE